MPKTLFYGAGAAIVTFCDADAQIGGLVSTHTFSGLSLGQPIGKSLVVAAIGMDATNPATFGSVIIDGVTATSVVTSGSLAIPRLGIFQAQTANTTGNIELNVGGTGASSPIYLAVWRLNRLRSLTAVHTDAKSNGTLALNVTKQGVALGLYITKGGTSGDAMSWTGLTESDEQYLIAIRGSAAQDAITATQTPLNISMAGAGTNRLSVGASWR